MGRLSRWTPLVDVLWHRGRSQIGTPRSTAYLVAYVAARCALEYTAVKRPKGKFYHGIVFHITRHRIYQPHT